MRRKYRSSSIIRLITLLNFAFLISLFSLLYNRRPRAGYVPVRGRLLTSLTSFEKEVSKKTFGKSVFCGNSKVCFHLFRKGSKRENFRQEILLQGQQRLLSAASEKRQARKLLARASFVGVARLVFSCSGKEASEKTFGKSGFTIKKQIAFCRYEKEVPFRQTPTRSR